MCYLCHHKSAGAGMQQCLPNMKYRVVGLQMTTSSWQRSDIVAVVGINNVAIRVVRFCRSQLRLTDPLPTYCSWPSGKSSSPLCPPVGNIPCRSTAMVDDFDCLYFSADYNLPQLQGSADIQKLAIKHGYSNCPMALLADIQNS
jgi:hypothetical protein